MTYQRHAFSVPIYSSPLWLALRLRVDSQMFPPKRGESNFLQFTQKPEMRIVCFFLIPQLVLKPRETPEEKLKTPTSTHTHAGPITRLLTGKPAAAQWHGWYSACCFHQKALGRLDRFKRYVTLWLNAASPLMLCVNRRRVCSRIIIHKHTRER